MTTRIKIKFSVLGTLFLLLHSFSFSQALSTLPSEVIHLFEGKENFDEITTAVETYYDSIPGSRTEMRSYKQWARWAYYMASRVDDNKKLINVVARCEEELQKYEKSHPGEARSSVGAWSSIGPSSILSSPYGSAIGIGRVDRIAFHPTDPDIFYIGTCSGGLFKTTDGGDTWSPKTDFLLSTGISGIAVSTDNPNKIFILTGDGDASPGSFLTASGLIRAGSGVYVSYNGGSSWEQTAPFPGITNYFGYKLVQDPANSNILLAATTQGIFRTDDGGGSWTQVLTGSTFDIEFKPGSSSFIYASQNDDFFRSTDGGNSFTEIFNISPSISGIGSRIEIAVTPAAPLNVYFMVGRTSNVACDDVVSNSFFPGIYKSTNSGTSFTVLYNDLNLISNCCSGDDGREQSNYDLAFTISTTNANYMSTGGIISWTSADGGSTFTVTYIDPNNSGQCANTGIQGYIHGDIHNMAYQPGTDRLFACTDGGLYSSITNGFIWDHHCDGIVASQVYHMGVSNVNSNHIAIGLQDNGIKSRNISLAWSQVKGADGFDNIYKYNSLNSGFYSLNTQVDEFLDNGLTTVNIIAGGGSEAFFKRVCGPPDNPDMLFVGDTRVRKFEKSNGSWSITNIIYSKPANFDIERCPSNASRYYYAGGSNQFATSGNMYRSDDIMESSITLFNNSPQRITDIAVHPTNSSEVWYTLGGFSDSLKVFRSTNSGSSFTNVSGSLPNIPIHSIVIHTNGDAYIGTETGIFYRGVNMNDWVPFDHTLPKVPVTDIEISNTTLVAATFGRGIWQSSLYSTCDPTATLAQDLSGRQIIERSGLITATNHIVGGINTDVLYKSNTRITLLPGFEAKRNNLFNATLHPCGVY